MNDKPTQKSYYLDDKLIKKLEVLADSKKAYSANLSTAIIMYLCATDEERAKFKILYNKFSNGENLNKIIKEQKAYKIMGTQPEEHAALWPDEDKVRFIKALLLYSPKLFADTIRPELAKIWKEATIAADNKPDFVALKGKEKHALELLKKAYNVQLTKKED